VSTTGVGLKIQMLKYLLEQKKCTMWYMILGTAICSCMMIHKSVSHSKPTDHLTFRLLLILKLSEHHFMEIIHTMVDRQNHKDELFVLNKL